jgi:hypothetical protein
MESEGLLEYSQEPSADPYQPDKSSNYHPILSL